MARIIAVCRSEKKGIKKEDIKEGYLHQDYGLADDAHADSHSHRQVSLIAIESIDKMRSMGFNVGPGDFAENLTTEGMEISSLPIGTEVHVGKEAIIEVTQIGKECHTGCAILHQIGKCIMPKEGVFAKVIHGGLVRTGDEIKIAKNDE